LLSRGLVLAAESHQKPGPDVDVDVALQERAGSGAIRIPPYPAVALKVERLLQQQEYRVADLAKLIASDQALAADVLRCANSALYSRGVEVTSLTQAIARIGAKDLRFLALAAGAGVHARAPGPLASLRRRVWLEGIASARICQELARGRGVEPEVAFVCGLLHDFGKLVAIAALEEIVTERRPAPRPVEAWLAVAERHHVDLGVALAARWNLPAQVADVVSRHHAGDWRAASEPRLVQLVQASDVLVRLVGESVAVARQGLAAVGFFTASECHHLGAVLVELPGFIASFESGAPAPPYEEGLVQRRPIGETVRGPLPVDFPVLVRSGRIKHGYQASGITPDELIIRGDEALPENSLLQVELSSEPPLACWATAKTSWRDGGAHVILLRPFALDREGLKSWRRIAGGPGAPAGAAAGRPQLPE